jgi:hypothetical protein
VTELHPEDAKLVTLARATRSRTGASEGAAVRDETGRTYTAATVFLDSLRLSAVQVAVATAASSGARQLMAAAVVRSDLGQRTGAGIADGDLSALRDLGGTGITVYLCDATGAVLATPTA